MLDPLPERKTLSLLVTLRCTAECGECGSHSGPHVRGRLDESDAISLIEQAAADQYEVVVFTGGEPMLYGVGLRHLVRRANELGMSTRMVSNAYWALSREKAHARLAPLVEAGLQELNVSTGDEHSRFVPITSVLYALRAGMDQSLTVVLMIETRQNNTVNRPAVQSHPLYEELFGDDRNEWLAVIESPWMPLDPTTTYVYPDGMAANRSNIATRSGCDSVIDTTTILADGRIMACCGLGTQSIPELQVGTVGVDSVAGARARAEADFLKRWIRNEGPEKILAWAASHDDGILWEDMYAHRCQACKRIYDDPLVGDVIRSHYQERILDVLASEWLLRTDLNMPCTPAGSQRAVPPS